MSVSSISANPAMFTPIKLQPSTAATAKPADSDGDHDGSTAASEAAEGKGTKVDVNG